MADDVEKDFDPNSIREAIYGDVCSENTEKNGRRLLVVGSIALTIGVFDVSVKSTPLLPLDFSKNPQGLLSFLAIANIALLVSYSLRAFNDLFKAQEDWTLAQKSIAIDKIIRARRKARDIHDDILAQDTIDQENPVDWYWEEYTAERDRWLQQIWKAESKLGEHRSSIFLRWVRLAFFGGLPLLVGVAATLYTWADLVALLSALLKAGAS